VNVQFDLGQPALPSPPVVGVFAGDLVMLGALIAAGITEHGGGPLSTYTLEVVAPFVIAWVALAPLAGLYRQTTLGGYLETAVRVPLAWAGIAIAGALVRDTALFPGGAPPVFVLVMIGVGTAVLLPWRLAVVTIRRRL
jgi:hypothetical protein